MRANAGAHEACVDEHHTGGGPETHGQDHQREAEPEEPVHSTRHRHLDREPDEREVDGHLREELGDAVGRTLTKARLRRHVQLLLDDGTPHRGAANHDGNQLEVPRLTQQGNGFSAANAFFLRTGSGPSRRLLAPDNPDDQRGADDHHAGADEQ